jgi:hypothetical protein
MKAKEQDIDIRDLKSIKQPFVITHDDWQHISDTITKWGVVTLLTATLLMFVLVFFIAHFVATLVDALIVNLMGLIISADIDFGIGMRLAAAARIPIVLIAAVPFLGGGISWIAWLVYLGFATYASKDNNAVHR